MKKYEYKVKKYYKVEQYICSIEDRLNEIAEDGWRCINILHGDDDGDYIFVFERLCKD